MRPVIHVVDSLGLGGVQTCLKAMVEHAPGPRRHYVVSLRTTEPHLEIAGGEVFCAPGGSRFSPRPLLPLLHLARALRNPIIHCYLFRSQVFGFAVARLVPEAKVIFHEHGRIVGRENEPWWEDLAFRLFLRISHRRVDRFIANTRHTRNRLEAAGVTGRQPILVVHNRILRETSGMASPTQRRAARAAFDLPADAFVFGYAGRITGTKGWREFVESARFYRNRTDLHWLIAGHGPDDAALREFIARENLSQVHCVGFQSAMAGFYQALDVCVVPSHWESHGLTQLEAQAHGLPVIITDVPGMNETVNRDIDALFFPPRSAPELIVQIERLLADPSLREKLSQAAWGNARNFTVDRYCAELESCYEAL
jgi:glycosyltransferase involved in cell wall biosynthesis